MVPVPTTAQGPDLDVVEQLVADDPSVKGLWCVPKYSNPSGWTCSPEVVRRLAEMPTAATDFRIYWDNAYAVHHLTDTPDQLDDLLAACERAGPSGPGLRLRLDLEDHLRRRRGVVLRQLARQRRVVAAARGQTHHRAGQDQPAPARAVPRQPGRPGRAHAAAPRDPAAQVRGRAGHPGRPAHRRRRRLLDRAGRRLLRQPDRPGRPGPARGAARRSRRREADPGRRAVPGRRRPAGPDDPAGADLPLARRPADGARGGRRLRAAGGQRTRGRAGAAPA